MRILHVTPHYAPDWHYGGTARSVTALAEASARAGAHVTVVTTQSSATDSRSTKPVWLHSNGVDICRCPASFTRAGVYSSVLHDITKAHALRSDVGHITSVWVPIGISAWRAFRTAQLPFVTSPRGALLPESFCEGRWKKLPYYYLFERCIQRDASVVHATSHLEKDAIESLLHLNRVELIPNICESRRWYRCEESGLRWRNMNGIAEHTAVVLFVGRIDPVKNLQFIASVMSRLHTRLAVEFVTIGPAERGEAAKLERAFAERPGTRLRMLPGTGSDEQLRAAYSAANVFVLPSLHENFSNVIAEAALCGLPVVASPRVGGAYLLQDYGCGTILPLDPSIWANWISMALTAPARSSRTDQLVQALSPEAIAQRWIELYQRLANKRVRGVRDSAPAGL
jgi:glycosyltransferase involved in cell wall biosynthesis